MIGPAVREARRAIGRHPLRSALITLTFAFGLASVVVVVGVVEGGYRSIRDSLFALGIDVIAALNPLELDEIPFLRIGSGGQRPVDLDAIRELREELGADVAQVLPVRLEMTRMEAPDVAMTNTVIVTEPGFEHIIRTGLLGGRFLEPGDRFIEGGVVDAAVDEALARVFEPGDPARIVGRELAATRRGHPFTARIVGVLRDPIVLRKHVEAFDVTRKARELTARRLEFLNLYLPFDEARDVPTGVLVQVKDPADVERIGTRMDTFFEARGIDPYFHVQKQWIDSVLEIVDRFTFLAHFIWVVNLLVVLVLVAVISLMAVEERYAEIAIRRVEGARVADVVLALLAEGAALALLAVPIGWPLAAGILHTWIEPALGWPARLPPPALWGTPLAILLVGLASYSLPARRVARLDPARVFAQHGE